MQENFTSLLAVYCRELLHKLTQVAKEDIRNVKNERGAFPTRLVTNVVDGVEKQKEVPYGQGDLFIAFALEDADASIVASERIGNLIASQYNFSLTFVIYGTESSFAMNRAILNMFDPEVLRWTQKVGLAFSAVNPKVETLDTMINGQWWLIRKMVMPLNCGVIMNTLTEEIYLEGVEIAKLTTFNIERSNQ